MTLFSKINNIMMLKNAICWVILPMVINAQNSSNNFAGGLYLENKTAEGGIQWTIRLSWSQVLQKAKAENKYVFVDCYATWCGPCKAMDKNVYPNETVGAVMNNKFISVKVQMDRTDKDENEVKTWYKDAKALDERYKIDAFPTLLFFSPDGSLVHRVTQGVNVDGFLDVVATALDVKKRYFSRLADYQSGKKDTAVMRDLIQAAKAASDRKMAEQISEDYFAALKVKNLDNKEIRDLIREFNKGPKAKELAAAYINELKDMEIYKEETLKFINVFTQNSKDKGFEIFYNHAAKVNEIINNVPLPPGAFRKSMDYAGEAVRRVLYKEEFYDPIGKPALYSNGTDNTLDWLQIKKNIRKKYPKADAERIVVDAKVNWYKWKQNIPEFSKSLLEQMAIVYDVNNLKGLTFGINNNCWDLFEKSNDTAILNRAIQWMEEAFLQNPKDKEWATAIDTYANLLYKVGRIKEALQWEEKAALSPDASQGIKNAFSKMQKGESTWPVN